MKNIRHPWSALLKGPCVSQWNQPWQCHINPGHTLLFYWVGLNKIIAVRLRARQGRVKCSDPHREGQTHLPEKTVLKKRLYQQDANRITGREFLLSSSDWQASKHFVHYLTGTQTKLFWGRFTFKENCSQAKSVSMCFSVYEKCNVLEYICNVRKQTRKAVVVHFKLRETSCLPVTMEKDTAMG